MNPYDAPNARELYEHALAFATEAHAGQLRKHSTDPYIVHPIRVAALARRFDVGERYRTIAQSVALLHDTIEDCDVTRGDIVEHFGNEVAYGVWGLTDCVGRGTAVPGVQNRAVRKALDKEWLRRQNPTVRALKLLDCADNLEDWPGDSGFLDLMISEMADLRAVIGHRLGDLMMQGVLDHFDKVWARVNAARRVRKIK